MRRQQRKRRKHKGGRCSGSDNWLQWGWMWLKHMSLLRVHVCLDRVVYFWCRIPDVSWGSNSLFGLARCYVWAVYTFLLLCQRSVNYHEDFFFVFFLSIFHSNKKGFHVIVLLCFPVCWPSHFPCTCAHLTSWLQNITVKFMQRHRQRRTSHRGCWLSPENVGPWCICSGNIMCSALNSFGAVSAFAFVSAF